MLRDKFEPVTAVQYGLEIVHSIAILDASGATGLLACEMQEPVRRIASREIDGVAAREFSRLMRPENFSDYALLQAFADAKTGFISLMAIDHPASPCL